MAKIKQVKLELHPVPDPSDPDWPQWIEVPAIMGCYMCAIEALPIDAMDDEAAKAFPRNVVDEYVTRGFDPTSVFTLSCGHDII